MQNFDLTGLWRRQYATPWFFSFVIALIAGFRRRLGLLGVINGHLRMACAAVVGFGAPVGQRWEFPGWRELPT